MGIILLREALVVVVRLSIRRMSRLGRRRALRLLDLLGLMTVRVRRVITIGLLLIK